MPLNLSRSDRRLLTWAALIVLTMIIVLAVLSNTETDSGIPSTYSSQASGAKAAYLLLQELGYKVARWEQPPGELPNDARGTVLVLAAPLTLPSDEDKEALTLYLTRGGRILATGATIDLYLPEAQTVRELAPQPLPQAYKPQLVTAITRAGQIRMSPIAYWKDCAVSCMAHYSEDGRPIVISYRFGQGEVVWWGSSTPLSNSGVSSDGNLGLLLNSLGRPDETHVLWDEYFHSSHRTAGSYLSEPPVLVGFGQLCLVVIALLLTYSRRNGPIYPLDEPSRLSPLEFVETLGGMYRRAHAVRAALEISYNRFRMQASQHLALKPGLAGVDLARLLSNRLGTRDGDLEDLVQSIESALYDPDLKESAALELAQRLNVYARQLHTLFFARQEISSHASSLAGAYSRKN